MRANYKPKWTCRRQGALKGDSLSQTVSASRLVGSSSQDCPTSGIRNPNILEAGEPVARVRHTSRSVRPRSRTTIPSQRNTIRHALLPLRKALSQFSRLSLLLIIWTPYAHRLCNAVC